MPSAVPSTAAAVSEITATQSTFGAAIIQLLGVSSRFVAQWVDLPSDLIANLRLASFGLILVVMFIYRPQGLIPEKREVRNVDGD